MRDTTEIENQIEDMVDRQGLEDVMLAIINICNGKAEHLRANWQDANAAREWERAAKRINLALSRWPTMPGISN